MFIPHTTPDLLCRRASARRVSFLYNPFTVVNGTDVDETKFCHTLGKSRLGRHYTEADPGEGHFLDQILETAHPPPPLSQGLDDYPTPLIWRPGSATAILFWPIENELILSWFWLNNLEVGFQLMTCLLSTPSSPLPFTISISLFLFGYVSF